jgi:hypothetical protein
VAGLFASLMILIFPALKPEKPALAGFYFSTLLLNASN